MSGEVDRRCVVLREQPRQLGGGDLQQRWNLFGFGTQSNGDHADAEPSVVQADGDSVGRWQLANGTRAVHVGEGKERGPFCSECRLLNLGDGTTQ